MHTTTDVPAPATQRPLHALLRAILLGGVVAGVLDALDGVVAYYFAYGMNPIQVLQYIASGALGEKAFTGGLLTAAAGAVFHFVIAFSAAAAFVLAAWRLSWLRSNWVVAGIVYGVWVWAFMTFVVLPMSAVKPGEFMLALRIQDIIDHALFVGLPIAYFARRVPGYLCPIKHGPPKHAS